MKLLLAATVLSAALATAALAQNTTTAPMNDGTMPNANQTPEAPANGTMPNANATPTVNPNGTMTGVGATPPATVPPPVPDCVSGAATPCPPNPICPATQVPPTTQPGGNNCVPPVLPNTR